MNAAALRRARLIEPIRLVAPLDAKLVAAAGQKKIRAIRRVRRLGLDLIACTRIKRSNCGGIHGYRRLSDRGRCRPACRHAAAEPGDSNRLLASELPLVGRAIRELAARKATKVVLVRADGEISASAASPIRRERHPRPPPASAPPSPSRSSMSMPTSAPRRFR